MAAPAAQASSIALLLLVLAQPQLAAAVPRQRGSAAWKASSLLDTTQAKLHWHAQALGRAIFQAVEAEPQPSQHWDEAARELVQGEAAYLAAEDDLAASLLHNFARGLLPLIAAPAAAKASVPTWTFGQGAKESRLQTLESTEMILQSSDDGQLLRTTRYCREGACVTQSEAQPPGEDGMLWDGPDIPGPEDVAPPEEVAMEGHEAWIGLSGSTAAEDGSTESASMVVLDGGPVVLGDRKDTGEADPLSAVVAISVDSAGSLVREAARSLAREMKETAETFGLAPVLDVVGSALRNKAPAALLAHDGALDEVVRAQLHSTWRSFMKSFFPDVVARQMNATSAGDNATPFLDIPFEVLSPSRTVAAESMSVLMGSEGGQAVRYTRYCRSGRCQTTATPVIEVDAMEEQQDEQEQQ